MSDRSQKRLAAIVGILIGIGTIFNSVGSWAVMPEKVRIVEQNAKEDREAFRLALKEHAHSISDLNATIRELRVEIKELKDRLDRNRLGMIQRDK